MRASFDGTGIPLCSHFGGVGLDCDGSPRTKKPALGGQGLGYGEGVRRTFQRLGDTIMPMRYLC